MPRPSAFEVIRRRLVVVERDGLVDRAAHSAPTFAVVVPSYQAAAFVGDAIRSIHDQGPFVREVIVVDDGSTDATVDVVGAFGGAVTLITKVNGGEASARNVGLHAATSDWVAFLDADDRFLPGRLRRISELIATQPDLDLITANGFVELGGEVAGWCYSSQWTFPLAGHRQEILRRNFIFGHVVVRRQRLIDLGGFDESISHTTDWEMWIRLILDGGQVAFVDEPLSIYRVHSRSLSADRLSMTAGSLSTVRAAQRNSSLTPSDAIVLAETAADLERRMDRLRTSDALVNEPGAIRPSAWATLCNPHEARSFRVKAFAAFTAPRLVSLMARRRRSEHEVGTMGRLVPKVATAVDDVVDSAGLAKLSPPMVSVVLPFLNEERFLEQAIETVQQQSWAIWELLLVDDGSTDASVEIADRWASDDRRVSVLRHPGRRNEGLPASRNLGLLHARGGTVALIDADDKWASDKLARQLQQMADHPEVAMICGPTWTSHSDGSDAALTPVVADAPVVLGRGTFARRLVRDDLAPPPPSNVLYRRSALMDVGGVPAGDNLYEDQRTFVAVSLRYPIFVGADPLSSYTVRPDSIYGSLANDPHTRWEQRQRFHRWTLDLARRSGFEGLKLVGTLALERVAHAARRPVRRVVSSVRRVLTRNESDAA